MIYYIVFSYPIIAGILWESARGYAPEQILIWTLSPLFLPIYLGMFLSKIYNK
jgi:hypothetical protein